MYSHVDCQVSMLNKAFSTLRAFIRLFSSVNSHVPFKTYFTSEGFSAQLAGKRLIPSVNSMCLLRVPF